MNHLRYFAGRESRVVDCAVIGSGGFGRSFLAHARNVKGLSCRAAFDREARIAADAMRSAGIAEADIVLCASPDQAKSAWAEGKYLACSDPELLRHLPLDLVLEATGNPEAGALHAKIALEAGTHLVMVSKETDSVIGPLLAALAREKGKVATPVDGDQPSLLIGLATWAEVCGLKLIAAGKSSEYDFVFDPETGQITANGEVIDAPGFGDWLEAAGRPWPEVAANRAKLAAALTQRAVPDLCEMTLVSNHLGLAPSRPDLNVPIARVTEVADFMALRQDGGLLDGPGVLDVFHCLRLPHEASFAGGVFVTVACDDPETWAMLRDKGHVMAQNGRTAMIGLPRHLLGLEAATSVFEAALLGLSSGADQPRQITDLTAFADADLAAGSLLLAEGHHHTIAHVSARMTPAQALDDSAPIPYYLLSGCRLRRDVKAGSMILCADVALNPESVLLQLRRLQDERAL